tara:strand:- start:168 stop:617 length:450 start_codon:yes stop_codon:yes gene_type:complete
MKLARKLKVYLVLLLILSFTSTALSSPGKYVELKKDQQIPWNGWCFDERAVANLIADKDVQKEKCDLRVQLELDKKAAEYHLNLGELSAKMDYEVVTRDATIEALKKENLALEQALIHENKFGWVAPGTIGIIVGALTAIIVLEFIADG